MNTRLAIDIGNTSTKASLWQGDTFCRAATMSEPDIAVIKDLIGPSAVNRAIVCSVRAVGPMFVDQLQKVIPDVTVLSHTTPTPLRNAYTSAATLGLDRLAAAVGASLLAPGRELLVADLGTAATYDHVSADATFAGGNIAPGLRLRLQSLAAGTSRLPDLTPLTHPGSELARQPFGTSTADAMIKGAMLGIVAEIEFYNSRLNGATVVVTGGDAPAIIPLLKSCTVIHDVDLVGRGLNRILSYNEES